MDLVDQKELESMRNQLEDAQRWNVSLQARLGAIQNRGGGVGGATDGGEWRVNTSTFSFLKFPALPFESFCRTELFQATR